MLYSCFNDKLRLYELFEDDRGHAMNADLPIPNLPPEVNGIGVPSTEAGRPLPSDARRIGTSWLPRGLVVRCKNLPVKGIGGASFVEPTTVGLIIAAITGIAIGRWYGSRGR